MQEEALPMQEEASGLSGSHEETRARLRSYLRVLDQVHAVSHLLNNAERLRDQVPAGVFENVQTDYRKRLKDFADQLAPERDLLTKGLRRYAREREILRNNCERAMKSIKELTFRYALGEYTSEYFEEERHLLAQQLLDSNDKLTKLDEISDLLEVAGFPIQDNTAQAPDHKHESAIPSQVRSGGTPEESGCNPPSTRAEFPAEGGSVPPAKTPDSQGAQSPAETDHPGHATSAPEREARLCLLNGPNKGNRIPLIRGNMSIGRAVDNDIRIPDPNLGSSHAMLIYTDGKYQLKNLDPLNRTYVNGIQVDSRLLAEGDVIALGEIRMSISSVPGPHN